MSRVPYRLRYAARPMVLCMGPARGWGGPIVLVPGGQFWTRRRAGVGFRWVVPDTHDYFLRRPGRLSSKSGADTIISCGDLRLVGSARHRKVSHSRGLGPAARWGGVPKVAPEPPPYMVLRAVWLVALVFQKVAPELLPWPVGVLVVAPMGWCSKSWGGIPKSCPRILDGVVFQKLGCCSKTLSQNPHGSMGWCSKSWDGVPKSCPRIPTLYTTEQNVTFVNF